MLQGLLQRVQAAVEKFLFWDEEVRAYEQRKVGNNNNNNIYIIKILIYYANVSLVHAQ